MAKLTHERLVEVLDYSPKTGIFLWRVSLSNRAKIGSRAGSESLHCKTLYRKLRIDGVLYFEHRLAWFYMKGEWPRPECEHADIDGVNNAWDNLRECTRPQNMANIARRPDNTSGYKGVCFRKDIGRWYARIGTNMTTVLLGYFDTAEAAHAAYCEASAKYHGDFGRTA
jgi:hypothetical protein